jgi:ribosome-binding factor A
MSERLRRVNDLLRDELSELIRRELKDPRLEDRLISVTEVETSPDLRHARAYVSLLGTAEERDEAMQALTHAAPFLRHELSNRVRLRHIPELVFKYDDRIEEGARVLSILNRVRAEREDGPGDARSRGE